MEHLFKITISAPHTRQIDYFDGGIHEVDAEVSLWDLAHRGDVRTLSGDYLDSCHFEKPFDGVRRVSTLVLALKALDERLSRSEYSWVLENLDGGTWRSASAHTLLTFASAEKSRVEGPLIAMGSLCLGHYGHKQGLPLSLSEKTNVSPRQVRIHGFDSFFGGGYTYFLLERDAA
jgi:hypothetical protein